MILVDSSVWVDFFSGRSTPQSDNLDGLLGREVVATGDLILTEVLQGFVSERHFRQARRLLDSLVYLNLVGREVGVQAALNYRLLRGRGITVRKTIDVVIATYCIVNDLPLLYSDRDFEPFVAHMGLRSALLQS